MATRSQVLPFGAAAYFERRLRYSVPLGLTGYTARVSRSGDKIFGTPSEVNLVALSRMIEDVGVTAETVTSEFLARRYGLDTATEAGAALAQAIELSFDVGRKMYYFLGFWALEKSSGLPDTLRQTALLIGRNIAKYDGDYQAVFASLETPTLQTLVDLRQEKNEALGLAAVARAHVERAAGALTAADADDLRYRFRHQELCTAVWREVAEAVWAFKMNRQGNGNATDLASWIDASLTELERLADVIDAELPPANQYPCPASEVRALAADLRPDFPARNSTERAQMVISAPTISVAGTVATVELATSAPAELVLEYGTKLPLYNDGGVVDPVVGGAAVTHRFQLPALPANSWYVVRAVARGAGPSGTDLVGSDYWIALRSTFVRDGLSPVNATASALL